MTIPPIPVENGQPLEATPHPTENGVLVEVCVTTDASGAWRLAWMLDGGRDKQLFGPALAMRDALDAAGHLNKRVWAQ